MHLRPENLVVSALASLLVGCGQSVDAPKTISSQCVDIPNGEYFRFVDGRLVSVTQREVDDQERPPETARRIAGTLAGMGYPWIVLEWDGRIAVISGIALDENSRSDAFIAAKSVFEADPVSGPLVLRVVNNMDVRDAEQAIAIRLTRELVEEDGLDWLRVAMAGKVATLIGTADSSSEKEIGYSIGRSTVESDLDASTIVNIVVDAITLSGNGDPVGLALIELNADASVADCQSAFNQVLVGRDVQFEEGESIVKRVSSRLLDAVTGVALLCEGYNMEIVGHIGPRETTSDALDLSQRRASSVRDYLMAYGVSPESLTARGYGRIDTIDLNGAPNSALSLPKTAFIVRPRDT